MADARKLAFSSFATPAKGVLVLFCEEGLKFGPATRKALAPTGDLVQRAAAADRFTGKSGSCARHRGAGRIAGGAAGVLGVGKAGKLKAQDCVKLGGAAMGKVPSRAERGRDLRGIAGGALKPDQAADLALGTQLRAYVFDRYKTKRKEGEERAGKAAGHDRGGNAGVGQKAWDSTAEPVADGVIMARDLINEPANVLFPEEFARRASVAQEARRRGRGARRAGDEEARHERAARRRAGIAEGQPRRHHALERRQEGRRAGRLHRQGRDASTPAAFRSSPRPAWRT